MKPQILERFTNKRNGFFSRSSQAERLPEFLAQGSFVTRLSQERKRAERSGRQFALMLVGGIQSPSIDHGADLFEIVAATLIVSVRRTDIVGSHEKDAAVGVILTEFGESSICPAIQAIQARIHSALRDELPTACMEHVRITFHIFPVEGNPKCPDFPADSVLYPDLSESKGNKLLRKSLKRTMDIAGSMTAILLFSPIFFIIAIGIHLTSKGPTLFRQERVGQFGRPFTFYKFRSMSCGAATAIHEDYVKEFIAGRLGSANAAGLFKLTDDPRVTQFGKFLRKTSLDELPQLFNVLKGEMSLVGPRPPIPYELQAYNQWHRRRLLEAQPGLTGLWQVTGRGRVRFDEMVRLDLRYAAEQSMWLDLCILAKTPWAVLSGRNTC